MKALGTSTTSTTGIATKALAAAAAAPAATTTSTTKVDSYRILIRTPVDGVACPRVVSTSMLRKVTNLLIDSTDK